MADAEFVTKLVDQVSAPALAGASGVDKLSNSLKKLQSVSGRGKGLRDVRGRFIKAGGAAQAAAGKIGIFQRAMAKLSGLGILPTLDIGNLVTGAFRAIQGIMRRVQDAVKAFVGAIVDSVLQVDQLKFGLTKFLGSEKKAVAEMAKLLAISNKLGISFESAVGTFRAFVSAGLTADAAREIVKFRADLEALATTPQQIAQVANAFEQMEKAIVSGKFEADGFNSILKGIPGADKLKILKIVAEKTGKSVKELSKDLSKLPVKETIEAFKEAFLEGVGAGKLGETAADQIKTVSGAIKVLKNIATNVFTTLATKLGPAIEKNLLPVFQDIVALLTSAEAGAFFDKVALAISKVIAFAGVFIEEFVNRIKAFAKAFSEAAGEAGGFGDSLEDLDPEDLRKMLEPLTAIAEAFGTALGTLFSFREAIVGFGESAVSVFNEVKSAVEGLFGFLGGTSGSLGASMTEGIAAGILGNPGAVVDALRSVVDGAIARIKSRLGISSPSDVFADVVGSPIGEGVAMGISGEQPTVNAALAGLTRPEAATGGATNNNTVNASAPVTVTVQAAEDPEATAQAVARILPSVLGDAFEQVVIQIGGAAA